MTDKIDSDGTHDGTVRQDEPFFGTVEDEDAPVAQTRRGGPSTQPSANRTDLNQLAQRIGGRDGWVC
jgi:hypothetical protein